MRRSLILAGIALLALPATVSAYDLPRKSQLEKYSAHWHKVRDCAGKRAPGRNIRRHGVRVKGKVRKASAREVSESIHQLRRHCQPFLRASSATAASELMSLPSRRRFLTARGDRRAAVATPQSTRPRVRTGSTRSCRSIGRAACAVVWTAARRGRSNAPAGSGSPKVQELG